MSKGYQLSAKAREDMRKIGIYLAQNFGLETALLVDEAYEEAFKLLGENPEMGPHNEDVAPLPFRIWPFKQSNILYRADIEPIQIIRIGRPGDWMQDV